ncbi:MAG: Asp-tRNA(Asn)/Glu-tRNA(Gln) amidotransferase subunit GatB [Phycisphaerae bacterium]
MTTGTPTRKAVKTKVLVGMEIHVQLCTASKMFTSAVNGFGGEPNTQVDPVVLGLPGVLPVINKKAVEGCIKIGMALGCQIARHTKWDRKSYYYPDLPKNYQISQYDEPLCGEGVFDLDLDGEVLPVRIRRAHLEEDAGKLLHDAPGGYHIDHSIVDLNRAGTPLVEIVTEPDFDSGAQVAAFGQALQKIVQFLGVSEGQMQMGHMRLEPNINVHITDESGNVHKTAITEVKNLNSFSVLQKAVDYEAVRQVKVWEETGQLGRKSTFGWDDQRNATVLQREKEEAHDYRYFPDPDLVPVEVDDAWLGRLRAEIGEMPQVRQKRYRNELGLDEKTAALLAGERALGDYYEQVIGAGVEAKRAANLMEALREVAAEKQQAVEDLGVSPAGLAEVAQLVAANKIAASKEVTKKVMARMSESPGTAEQAATDLQLIQSTDTGALDAAIDAVIAANPQPLQDYRGGKQSAVGALVGLVMKQGKGLNPKLVQQRLREKLS